MWRATRRLGYLVAAGLFALLCATARESRADPGATDGLPLQTAATALASYDMVARLDEVRHIVHARARITFVNPSDSATDRLYFHLYLNAFENERTLFMRSGAGRSGVHGGRRARLDIRSLTSPRFGSTNLWENSRPSDPSEKHDRTDVFVQLPEPLAGHETIELEVVFDATLPELIERTGYVGDFHLVAQWFPKLAKREPGGRWAHFPFHAQSEFYADFGDYRVELDVPAGYVVGSTGQLSRLPAAESERARYLALADSVHDFAWTAWPGFNVEERTLHGVMMRVLAPASARLVREATWQTLERGLAHLNSAYGTYPYRQLTIVVPPSNATRAGGMEYPQFITTGGNELHQQLGARAVELVTIHELAHQWFQGMLASNEAAHPFLDEGITAYAEWRYLEEVHGPCSILSFSELCVSRWALGRYTTFRAQRELPVELAAAEFRSFAQISQLVYSRTPLSLLGLEAYVSKDAVHEALRAYAVAHRFRHPTPEDFYATLERGLGSSAVQQLKRALQRKGWLDLSIADVHTRTAPTAMRTTVHIERRGSLWFPFDVVATFVDGKQKTKRFNHEATDLSWKFEHHAPLRRVELDPQHQVYMDRDWLNNRYHPRPEPRPNLLAKWVAFFAYLVASWGI